MTLSAKRYLKPVLIITLLVIMLLTFSGCEDFGQFAPAEPPAEQPEPEKPATSKVISSEDKAILAVYEHLLSHAGNAEAKMYLAEFYATCDNWTAETELFKDGTSLWYVLIDMTEVKDWAERPHWQQAGWLVFLDGKVVPSNRIQANALRIEADLQEISPPPEP